ncbi:MAG: ABC transporter substrate-binding protein [Bacteroidales bacterium]
MTKILKNNLIHLSILLIVIFLFSCNSILRDDKGEKIYNGNLRINETDKIETLYPPKVKELSSIRAILQIHEGLVKYDVRTLSIKPALAYRWEEDTLNKTITFFMRPNVRFCDDKCFPNSRGRKITAYDFEYSIINYLLDADTSYAIYEALDIIKGIDIAKKDLKYNTNPSVEGIKVLNDTVIKIFAVNNTSYLLYLLANPVLSVIPKEAVELYGENLLFGTGPFYCSTTPQNTEKLILLKNKNYYGKDDYGNKLPFLDSITISFHTAATREMRLFIEDQLDIVFNLRSDYISDFVKNNISKFEMNPPAYILSRTERIGYKGEYNIMKSYVNGLYTNKMDYVDFSYVYFKQPEERTNYSDAIEP